MLQATFQKEMYMKLLQKMAYSFVFSVKSPLTSTEMEKAKMNEIEQRVSLANRILMLAATINLNLSTLSVLVTPYKSF